MRSSASTALISVQNAGMIQNPCNCKMSLFSLQALSTIQFTQFQFKRMAQNSLKVLGILQGESHICDQSLEASPMEQCFEPDLQMAQENMNQNADEGDEVEAENAGAEAFANESIDSNRVQNLQSSQRSLLTEKIKQGLLRANSEKEKAKERQQEKFRAQSNKVEHVRINWKALPIKEIDFKSYRTEEKKGRKKERYSKMGQCGQCGQCTIF